MINAEVAEERRGKSLNDLSYLVIRCAMKVHTELGPGLLESAYEACLSHELRKSGLKVETQVALPVHYDGIQIDLGYRLDLVVNDQLVVELKAIENVLPVHKAQVLSYLRLSKKRLGLLINFHVTHLREGITRIVNRL
ncbi:MAG: GxxExxY protein [Acidobacteriaceae bacterium]